MTADQGEKIAVGGKINVLSSGKAKDVGETKNLALAASSKGDRIGAPIHLPLNPWLCLKSNDRIAFRFRA